jgi:hypothetical protein
MFSRFDPIEDTVHLTSASRAKMHSVIQARISTGLALEATRKAVLRSRELIRHADDAIKSWGALVGIVEEQKAEELAGEAGAGGKAEPGVEGTENISTGAL